MLFSVTDVRFLPWLCALAVPFALSGSVLAETKGAERPAWRAVPAVTFEALPPSSPVPTTGLRGLSPIPAPAVPVPGDPGTTLYITPENPQGVLVPAARTGRIALNDAAVPARRSYTLSDAMREAAWREKTAARLEALAGDGPGL